MQKEMEGEQSMLGPLSRGSLAMQGKEQTSPSIANDSATLQLPQGYRQAHFPKNLHCYL